jgi:hypothetical protein
MLETLSRSFELTKLSFAVIRQDLEMLLFPALGSLFSLLYCALVLWPTILSHLLDPQGTGLVWGTVQWVAAFATYFGLAFIGTFFNTCVVYTAKTRFAGGDATFGESLSFAVSRLHLVFLWSLVAASVGVLLRALDQAAERAGGIAAALLAALHGVLGLMWSVVTLFVVPVMVYEGLGPFDAVRRSVQVLKRTWGESLVRHFGLGLVQMLATLPAVLLVVLALAAGTLLLPLLVLAVVYVVVVSLVFSVANSVFNAALYEYATSGAVPGGFDRETLRGAFVTGGRSRRAF